MKVLRALTCIAGVAAMIATAGAGYAHAEPTVYNTPGATIDSSGRMWNTTCDKYSSSVVRCRTEIWATTVKYENGKYQRVTGWAFNNLTYLPSSPDAWTNNNLARNAAWTSAGRQWRTECDTPNTGTGACRTYARVDYAVASWTGSTWKFTQQSGWLLNNIVQFATGGVTPVTQVPAWIIDQSRLSYNGLGPIKLGTPMSTLGTLGYAYFYRGPDQECSYWKETESLTNRGIWYFNGSSLDGIVVQGSSVKTVSGAHVGMTYGEVKAIYGSQLQLETKDGYLPVYTAVLRNGSREMIFMSSFELQRPLQASDPIAYIIVRDRSNWLGWDGC